MIDLTVSREELMIQKKEAELREAKRKKNASRRAFETRMKCVIGGTMHKYFPQAFLFEQPEWNSIISKVVRSDVFIDAVKEIVNKNPELWNKICEQEKERIEKENKKKARQSQAGKKSKTISEVEVENVNYPDDEEPGDEDEVDDEDEVVYRP